ncbi:polysaccharide deacetylase family protein [Lichenicola cladoniae]|uniref:Chitooligosaccharide deacetylase n=2 Tax=Lichenicola cladoniae TaxID=1484109 RepID=A0A6M8HV11_9PROT|nr:polysaccharide deacetylase family protein [Lichenicola cladoniae]
MLPHHGRYGYRAITERPAYRWPGDKRLAVYVALGVECYAFGEGLVENLVPGGAAAHDVLNTSWREYGNRVGAWRILDGMNQLGLPLTILMNSAVYREAPSLAAAFRTNGCEIVAHGSSNSDTMAGMSESEEQAYIAKVTETIGAAEGRQPSGWASPWIAETPTTPDALQEAGYRYLLDWCMDDQPVWLNTRKGRLLSVPYSQEINDSSTIIGRMASASTFADMIVDQFDQLLADSEGQPLVMSVILHSFIAGQPFRLRSILKALAHIAAAREVLWLTTPGAIADQIYADPALAP